MTRIFTTVLLTLLAGGCSHQEEPNISSPEIAATTEAKNQTNVSVAQRVASSTDASSFDLLDAGNNFEELQYSSNNSGFGSSIQMSDATLSQAENTSRFAHNPENGVKKTSKDAISTLSLDADTASYSLVRRLLRSGELPPADAVRIEEFLNYFHYDYPASTNKHPFGIATEIAPAPWNKDHLLLRVGVQTVDQKASDMPAANLVFLVDVSGSMDMPDKLPLLKSGLKLLVKRLRPQDHVAIISYASNEKKVLSSTSGDKKAKIINAIDSLQADGSTSGEKALRMAYNEVRQNWQKNGINRILMATDGDFNVGVTDNEQLKDMVRQQRDSGVTLSILGFGVDNLNDAMMEQLADVGNGNYGYIDSLEEAQRILGDELTSTFNTVAQDVKIQLQFNKAQIAEWRLIGYENRVLQEANFRNDKVDAGDVGAGKSVTALYELTPVGKPGLFGPHRYDLEDPKALTIGYGKEIGFLQVRYKQPGATKSVEFSSVIQSPTATNTANVAQPSADLNFAASVAAFGQLLRHGQYTKDFGYVDVIKLASSSFGADENNKRHEFVELVKLAESLQIQR